MGEALSAADHLPFRRAVVTGGAGFIGSHLVDALLARGIETISIDSYVAGKEENLREGPNRHLLRAVRCDVTDYAALREHFRDVDVVFHNAASKKTVSANDPRTDLRVNAEGTLNVLELAREFGVRKVVHASTGSVYGEAQYFPQDEAHPFNPVSYYGVSKLAAEKYALVFGHLYGLDVTVLRYFHVYGPRQESADDRGGVVAIFCRRALAGLPLVIYGDGEQQRSFTYVGDVVRVNLLVATHPRAKGQVFNCASGLKITIKRLACMVRRLSGRPDLPIVYGPWTPGDIKVFEPDNGKLRTLGFSDWTAFECGLLHTLAWYGRQ